MTADAGSLTAICAHRFVGAAAAISLATGAERGCSTDRAHAQASSGSPADVIYRGVLPFLAVYLVALALITYVPAISLVGVTLLFPN
jgi:hypothetical protein